MVLIRKCELNDIPKVVQLSVLWSTENITHGFVANTADDLMKYLDGYFYVAQCKNEIVGYVMGKVHESDGIAVVPLEEKYLDIEEVFVQSEFRKQKVGHQLVDHIMNEAGSHGVSRLLVSSATKQWQQMVGFYEQHGFKMWFVQMYR